jgi:hypothetical protein
MIPEQINQNNFRILLPAKIAQTVKLISDDTGVSEVQVFINFYNSSVYKELENEKSKRWWDSPLQLCDEYERKCVNSSPVLEEALEKSYKAAVM